MNLSATSVSSAATLTPMPKVGELDARFKRNEDLFLGNAVGPERGYASLEQALSGAAGLVQHGRGGTMAIVRGGDAFQAHELLQPVWEKGFAREYATGYDSTELVPLAGEGEGKVGFYKYQQDKYGGREDKQRTGTVKLDAHAGVQAIVGSDWAIVDGRLQPVEARRPEPPKPTKPTKPPVDPRPPVDPKPPVNPGGGRTLVEDVTEAARLANEALRIINTVPPTDRGDESTKDVRIKAYKTNMAAQARLEKQFTGNTSEVTSTLRSADASLEDANWQLAKKPSPDGRFNGVDVPGAARDTQRAVELLDGLLDQLTAATAA